ncbi:hypothetical protein KL86DPRO_11277 [uncultured delta proteobacterium]|uniref:YD repeat-containing protein n=1 Tax=uncultured delta proteobacterium TaxID=34034 RepID=A0A212JEB7_9DELT|nr:hypothetical protein KL86DPRO_11277 [uncultured delta proteobacterium]
MSAYRAPGAKFVICRLPLARLVLLICLGLCGCGGKTVAVQSLFPVKSSGTAIYAVPGLELKGTVVRITETSWVNADTSPAAIARYLPVDGAGQALPPPAPDVTQGLRLDWTANNEYGPGNLPDYIRNVSTGSDALVHESRYVYTVDGLVARVETAVAGKTPAFPPSSSRTVYTYGQHDELLARETTHVHGNGNAAGHATEKTVKSVTRYEGYRFDAAGNVLERLVRNDGELVMLQKFSYDAGRLTAQADLDLTLERGVYQGDPHHGMTLVTPGAHRRGDFDVVTTYRYDAAGRLAERVTRYGYHHDADADAAFYREHGGAEKAVPRPSPQGKSEEKNSLTREVFFYDARGNCVRVQEFSGDAPVREWRYRYDGRGNWVRRVQRFAPDGLAVVDREIEYAPEQ